MTKIPVCLKSNETALRWSVTSRHSNTFNSGKWAYFLVLCQVTVLSWVTPHLGIRGDLALANKHPAKNQQRIVNDQCQSQDESFSHFYCLYVALLKSRNSVVSDKPSKNWVLTACYKRLNKELLPLKRWWNIPQNWIGFSRNFLWPGKYIKKSFKISLKFLVYFCFSMPSTKVGNCNCILQVSNWHKKRTRDQTLKKEVSGFYNPFYLEPNQTNKHSKKCHTRLANLTLNLPSSDLSILLFNLNTPASY